MSKAVPGFLGPYRLVNVVHEGHGCRLWKAIHESRQTPFAIKVPLERLKASKRHAAYLKREWTVGRSVAHEKIIAVHELGYDEGVPYLVLEWYPAPNMKNRIRQGFEATTPLVQTIVLQATEALVHFHSCGWLHRDVKPENFLVSDAGDVKLIDFALALRKPGLLGRLVGFGGKVQGTRSYMSPEQIRCKPLDERSDLYSLACTLYELVAGRPPFTADNANDLLNKHLKAPPPSLEAVQRNVTREFAQLIRRAMAKDPDERFRSTREFYQELRRVSVFRRGVETAGP
ncbi:MAG: serine/threonine protein kinase [Thermoguttaceae bacterium]|nr:serine/threonine protein kinase [Thermoguttaceae bacterium]